jgi:uncharacterized protein YndB with AHSA1/START domain
MEYSVSINVNAKPNKLWALLTNSNDFPRWNSTVEHIEGKIGLGETIKLKARIASDRVFTLKVGKFVPNDMMVWQDGNAPMFTGVRTFTLTPQSNGSTDFTMSEVYAGLMMPMIAGSLPDFIPTFEQYAVDIKKEAEKSS